MVIQPNSTRLNRRDSTGSSCFFSAHREPIFCNNFHFMVFSTLCRAASTGFFSDNTTTAKEIDAPCILLWQHHGNTVRVLLWSVPFSRVWLLCFLVFFLQKNSNLPLRLSLPATPHDTPPSSSGASHFSDCRSTEMSWPTTSYASLIQRPSTINMQMKS